MEREYQVIGNKRGENLPQAFNVEFYEGASDQQIIDDMVSYLGEYRFEVSDFQYELGFRAGEIVDPVSGESMALKSKRAIREREEQGLDTSREEAEYLGMRSLGRQLIENPTGTVVWFSPTGPKELGYGDYGFGFTGKLDGEKLKMTAIRLEDPNIADFNKASRALTGEEYDDAEGYLRNPRVIDVDEDKVNEFIHGNFEIKSAKSREIFEASIRKLKRAIEEFPRLVREGRGGIARNAIENMAIELRRRLEGEENENVVYLDHKELELSEAMKESRYNQAPPPTKGSCGLGGGLQSPNIFRGLRPNLGSGAKGESESEWFVCPKCDYHATGPVGNECPSCHLTKEEFAEDGGEACA